MVSIRPIYQPITYYALRSAFAVKAFANRLTVSGSKPIGIKLRLAENLTPPAPLS